MEAAPAEDRPSYNDIKVHDINSAIHSVCSNIDSLIQDILKERPELQKYDTHIIEWELINYLQFFKSKFKISIPDM